MQVTDFDFIVIGSGFRRQRLGPPADREGLSGGGHGDGPPLDAGEPAAHQLADLALDLAAGLALRGFFNIDAFRHVMILHGCAVGGGSITYANTLLVPRDGRSGRTDRGRAWRHWKAEMPRHYDTAVRMLGVTENRILGPADQILKHAAEARGSGRHLLSHAGRGLRSAGRRVRRQTVSRSVLRRRRTGAHHLHRLRRLHDGLPLQREEHAGPELPLPGGEARRPGVRRNQGGGCPAAGRQARTEATATRCVP